MAQMPGEHVVKVRAELDNALVVRPGDKLVIALAKPIDMATFGQIRERITGRLPGVETVIIDGVSGLAVYRASDDTAATRAMREIWEHLEQSDEAFSAARLRRIIAESGTLQDGQVTP
jgi:hypothetical protein